MKQHTLARRHLKLFACRCGQKLDCRFIWQNDKHKKISRRVPLDDLEAQDWIHNEDTEKWITELEKVILSLYEQISRGDNPVAAPANLLNTIQTYVCSVVTRRDMKESFEKHFDEMYKKWKSPDFIYKMAAKRAFLYGETMTIAIDVVMNNFYKILQSDKMAWRSQIERDTLDDKECLFKQLFVLLTTNPIVLPDISFCQKGSMVFMPASPNISFVAVIGYIRNDAGEVIEEFCDCTKSLAILPENHLLFSENAVDASVINRFCEFQEQGRFLYSPFPMYAIEKDCCPLIPK